MLSEIRKFPAQFPPAQPWQFWPQAPTPAALAAVRPYFEAEARMHGCVRLLVSKSARNPRGCPA